MKIMIVDDELVSRKKMAQIFSRSGIVHEVENGEDAILSFEKARKSGQPYHVIMLDLSMPGMNGLEVLDRIRGIESVHHTPPDKTVKIVVVTAHNERDIVITAKEKGCSGYIMKPFDKAMVADHLRHFGIFIK